MLSIIAISLASGLAINIGANNAGVHMGPAYGAGARNKWTSLFLFGIFTVAGALSLGQKVTETVARGLYTQSLESHPWVFLVIAPLVTVLFLSIANYFRQPVPTTLIAICSLLGVGIAYDMLNGRKVFIMCVWWVITPIATLAATWLTGKVLQRYFLKLLIPSQIAGRMRVIIGWLLTLEGCYSSFAIGSNNVAKSMGPIVGAGTVTPFQATIIGGAGMALGGIIWGGRVLQTVGKGITELCYVRALAVGLLSATGLLVASINGAPVSGACIVTTGVIGFGMATNVQRTDVERRNVRFIAFLWAAGPALAIFVSYLVVIIIRY